jgi:hypothetical protein
VSAFCVLHFGYQSIWCFFAVYLENVAFLIWAHTRWLSDFSVCPPEGLNQNEKKRYFCLNTMVFCLFVFSYFYGNIAAVSDKVMWRLAHNVPLQLSRKFSVAILVLHPPPPKESSLVCTGTQACRRKKKWHL